MPGDDIADLPGALADEMFRLMRGRNDALERIARYEVVKYGLGGLTRRTYEGDETFREEIWRGETYVGAAWIERDGNTFLVLSEHRKAPATHG